jgi:putative Ca2+/H+ antiporter (TMEM165/GDT1 family)
VPLESQIDTVAFAAHDTTPLMVIAGTTLGMLIADVSAVFADTLRK